MPGGEKIFISDTVGFVSNLPHHLVEAYKTTLDVVIDADLLVHVVDGSKNAPEEDIKAVRTVLRSINADNIPEIIVFNKLDRGQSPNHMFEHPNSVQVSAKTGEGVEKMIDAIGELLRSELQVYELKIPFSRGDVIAQVHREGQVLSETTEEDNLTMRVRLDAFAYERLKKYRKTMKVT